MRPREEGPWELPKPRVSFCLEHDNRFDEDEQDSGPAEFFDAKFCPYLPLGVAPVFAGITKNHIVLCRLNAARDPPCEILMIIRDEDVGASNYCCTWTQDHETGQPYLCVAGVDAKIKIYDMASGKLVTCLVGHGGDINDLITSPADPLIIASASDDTTVRVWSLRPSHDKQPCLAILGGEAHTWNLLTIAFHDSGNYLLSAGHDHVINLWTLPELPTEPIVSPIQVYYPHFSTSEIHGGVVDCVAFYGDNILSRACHDEVIVMWRVEGFSSRDPPPPASTAPTSYDPSRTTRSAFAPPGSSACPAQYTRLMEFETPGCGPQFFMRFGLFFEPGEHPVLAFCNAGGKVFFWDFERITAYHEFMKSIDNPDRDKNIIIQRPSWLQPIYHRQRADPVSKLRERDFSDRDSVASGQTGVTMQTETERLAGTKQPYSEDTLDSWEEKYNPENSHDPLKPHKVEYFGQSHFLGRRAVWSPAGEWCVVVGSSNFALVFHRWSNREV